MPTPPPVLLPTQAPLRADARAPAPPPRGVWPGVWWRLLERRLGVFPWPVAVVFAGVIAYFVHRGAVPIEINMMIAVIGLGGFLCAEVGKRLPLVRDVGGAAICATFIPSALVYYHLLPAAIVRPVTDFTKATNFLYLFIAAIIVGSILGMDRRVLIRGFFKVFVPLAAGSILALLVGTAVGTLLGLGFRHTLLFIVVPIMAGGIGEGAIPLSVGYADLLHLNQGEMFAQLLPPVMLGSLAAILLSGLLNFLGRRRPELTGEGRLQPGEREDPELAQQEIAPHLDVEHIAAAGSFALALYLVGLVAKEAWDFPAPVAMLFLAVAAKLGHAVPPQLQQGAATVYRFFRVAVTYPLLFAIGAAMTPWDTLLAALALPNLLTILATVVTLMGTGFVVARRVNLYPIEAAIVNACHSGQGGTGDVAILTAANRMQLMPFAQIATRLGGAVTVTATLLLLAALR